MKYDDFIKKIKEDNFAIDNVGKQAIIVKGDFVFVCEIDANVDFDDFLYKYNQNFTKKKEINNEKESTKKDFEGLEIKNNTLNCDKSTNSVMDDLSNSLNYKFINNELEKDRKTANNYSIGEQDLYPSMLLRDKNSDGSFLDPSHPIFGSRKEKTNNDDIDVPPLARFDPISPETKGKNKKKKKGNDPNPDHYKPDDDNNSFL